jgi:hypothetical protein
MSSILNLALRSSILETTRARCHKVRSQMGSDPFFEKSVTNYGYEPLIPLNRPPCPKCQRPTKLSRLDFGPRDARIQILDLS